MIRVERKDDINIVTFEVEKINALITEEIKKGIVVLFSQPNTSTIIDFTGIKYIDSSGFGSLLSVLKESKNNYGTLKLNIPDEKLLSMFKILFLHSIFEIHSDLEECIKSFKK